MKRTHKRWKDKLVLCLRKQDYEQKMDARRRMTPLRRLLHARPADPAPGRTPQDIARSYVNAWYDETPRKKSRLAKDGGETYIEVNLFYDPSNGMPVLEVNYHEKGNPVVYFEMTTIHASGGHTSISQYDGDNRGLVSGLPQDMPEWTAEHLKTYRATLQDIKEACREAFVKPAQRPL